MLTRILVASLLLFLVAGIRPDIAHSQNANWAIYPAASLRPGSIIGVSLEWDGLTRAGNSNFSIYIANTSDDLKLGSSWSKLESRLVDGRLHSIGRLPNRTGRYALALVYKRSDGYFCSGNPACLATGSTGVLYGTNLSLETRTPCESATTWIDVQDSQGATLDMKRFWNFAPGNFWVYEGTHHATGNWFITRIEVENPETICGRQSLPLRFTKDNSRGYWGGNYGDYNGTHYNLRWFITYGANEWEGEIGALGDKRYQNGSLSNLGTYKFGYVYPPPAGLIPYRLSSTTERVGNVFYRESQIVPNGWEQNPCSGSSTIGTPHGWFTLIREGPQVGIQGQTKRTIIITFLEGPVPLWTQGGGILREDWVLAEGVGIYQIQDRTFGQYGVFYNTPDCLQDLASCLGPGISGPYRTITLARSYLDANAARSDPPPSPSPSISPSPSPSPRPTPTLTASPSPTSGPTYILPTPTPPQSPSPTPTPSPAPLQDIVQKLFGEPSPTPSVNIVREQVPVSVIPQEVVSQLPEGTEIKEVIQITKVGDGSDSEGTDSFYEIRTSQPVKLAGIIPVSLEKTLIVSPQTREIVREEKSLLTKFLELLFRLFPSGDFLM